MGIILGLVAAFGWGTGDFITRNVAHKIGALRATIYVQLFGGLAMALVALALGEFTRAANIPLNGWLVGLIGGAIGVFASFTLFNAFEHGVLMIVSPIVSSFGAITVLLSLLSGETLSPLRSLGIGISIIGVILASIEWTPESERGMLALRGYRLPPGVGFAILSAVLFGVNFWMLGFYVVPALGPVLPVVVTRAVGVPLLLAVALLGRSSVAAPGRRVLGSILAIAAIDTIAFLANNVGMQTEQVAVVATLSSLFAAVTVVLAWIVLGERIRRGQWLGIGLILVGILLVSL